MIKPDGSNILFVVGCPRSGTTWLHRLIASHPDVCTGQESNLFLFYISPLLNSWKQEESFFDKRGPNGLCCYISESEYFKHVSEFAASCLGSVPEEGKRFFLEKTTSHVSSAEDIMDVFPKTKIILTHRHPFEVVPSLVKAGLSWGKGWAPTTTRAAAKMWKRYANHSLRAMRKLNTTQMLTIRFDQLRDSPITTLRGIYEFLDLDLSEEEIKENFNMNIPGNRKMLPIPLRGKYEGQYIEEPQGFYRKQDKAREIAYMDRLQIYLIAKREMKLLGYSFR